MKNEEKEGEKNLPTQQILPLTACPDIPQRPCKECKNKVHPVFAHLVATTTEDSDLIPD